MEKIYQQLAKAGISPNQHYILWCIRAGIAPSMVNVAMEMRIMGLDWIDGNELTGKALSLLMEIDENFKDKKSKSDVELMGENWREKIAEYRLIFQDGKLPSGKYARDTVKNMEPCFRWFFNNYEFDWDTIMKATKKYCADHEVDNKYQRTSKYFIVKSDGGAKSSDLGTYCEKVITGGGEEEEPFFRTRVV